MGLQPGDRVHLRSLGRDGQVKAVDEARGRAEIEVSGIKVRTDWKDLARPGHVEEKKEVGARVSLTTFTSAPRELNLIGLIVDQALPLVDKSLDQAQVGGVKSFSIIHGIGTGRLREAVRGYLRHDSRVRAFHPGARRAGGEGVTVIELFE
ncbi:MAG: Smr/MutS family protein [Thermodesulfobacteriota bacterium]|nr:Smr/MutS family protein [Thermodesulfobacteriota bacterium]